MDMRRAFTACPGCYPNLICKNNPTNGSYVQLVLRPEIRDFSPTELGVTLPAFRWIAITNRNTLAVTRIVLPMREERNRVISVLRLFGGRAQRSLGVWLRECPALATPSLMAKTTGGLFLAGGSLATVVTAQMPAGSSGVVAMCVAALVGVCVGVVLLVYGERFRPCSYQLFLAIATTLITVAIYSAPTDTAALAIASFYLLVACDAFAFFGWFAATAHVVIAITCCIWVLGTHGVPWWSGMAIGGAATAVSVLIGILGRMATEGELDSLTGLPNRRGLDRALNLELARGARPTVVLIDIDGFTSFNDRYGDAAGDAILRDIADTWSTTLDANHFLSRSGGDEFTIAVGDISESEATDLTARLRLQSPLGLSAGIATWQPGDSASMLVYRADVGLYHAKSAGRNCSVVEPA
jgi:diguanylate cyclase (GGDEF)-like protein